MCTITRNWSTNLILIVQEYYSIACSYAQYGTRGSLTVTMDTYCQGEG